MLVHAVLPAVKAVVDLCTSYFYAATVTACHVPVVYGLCTACHLYGMYSCSPCLIAMRSRQEWDQLPELAPAMWGWPPEAGAAAGA